MCALEKHFLGTNGITAGGIPIATGAAYALKYKGSDQIVVAFFGDGASNQGTFHESLNMAALWTLPVLYVCENNHYGMSIPVGRSTACSPISARAGSYGMRGETCDGMDVAEVKRHAAELIHSVRSGHGPALLELLTYRFCGHSKNDARVYRTREEEAQWEERDCLKTAAVLLGDSGFASNDIEAIEADARRTVDNAVQVASSSPYGNENDAVGGVYA